MGLMDELGKQIGNLAGSAMKNPQTLSALMSLLSSRDTSVGGSGGLGGLIQAFQGKGLGDVMSSWISTGPNAEISAKQVDQVLGSDVLRQFADKAGVPHHEAGGVLANLLPSVIDQLTPGGQVPDTDSFESALGGLLKGFLR